MWRSITSVIHNILIILDPLDKNFADFDNRDEADFLEEEGTLKHELAC